jgi:hypothetical protein
MNSSSAGLEMKASSPQLKKKKKFSHWLNDNEFLKSFFFLPLFQYNLICLINQSKLLHNLKA